uniref:THAP-type domain-containing protein n=1 Tax=Macrostomum lignano TaxID=282301 RepID=A0A1I8J6I5_9PLAT
MAVQIIPIVVHQKPGFTAFLQTVPDWARRIFRADLLGKKYEHKWATAVVCSQHFADHMYMCTKDRHEPHSRLVWNAHPTLKLYKDTAQEQKTRSPPKPRACVSEEPSGSWSKSFLAVTNPISNRKALAKTFSENLLQRFSPLSICTLSPIR